MCRVLAGDKMVPMHSMDLPLPLCRSPELLSSSAMTALLHHRKLHVQSQRCTSASEGLQLTRTLREPAEPCY